MLDIVHALEYLWRAAYAFHKDGTPEAEAWVDRQLVKLLSGASGGTIAKSLRLMAKRHDLDATAAAPVEKAAAYLVKHTRLLHYDRALADGLPIATGVIEGACRYLVQTAWAAPALVGRSPVPKRSFGTARCARAATSMTTVSPREGPRADTRLTLRRRRDSNPLPPSRSHLKLVK